MPPLRTGDRADRVELLTLDGHPPRAASGKKRGPATLHLTEDELPQAWRNPTGALPSDLSEVALVTLVNSTAESAVQCM
jgi:hypothetical protein